MAHSVKRNRPWGYVRADDHGVTFMGHPMAGATMYFALYTPGGGGVSMVYTRGICHGPFFGGENLLWIPP